MVKIRGTNQGVQELKNVLIAKGLISDAELKEEKIKINKRTKIKNENRK